MKNMQDILCAIDWQMVTSEMDTKGFALVPKVLSNAQCEELVKNYNNENDYRKTVVMERYRFGIGEYKYFNYPLPGLIQSIRENVYSKLAPIANGWMKMLNIGKKFPGSLQELQILCRAHNQVNSTVLILKYGKGGHNTLHQDLYGEIFFPMQIVLFLNEPGKDFTGGEFILTQQPPRAHSKGDRADAKEG